jgi:hypothetical protein
VIHGCLRRGVVPASRDLDLDYWIFVLTLSDEEDQEITPAEPPFGAGNWA